jgi:hypothetical protein
VARGLEAREGWDALLAVSYSAIEGGGFVSGVG